MLSPLTAVCLAAAAHAYQIPESDLYAILAVEGGRVGQAVADRNGTQDLGPFQINTAWGPAIALYWKLSVPKALDRVRDNGCANSVIASAILKKCLIEAHGDYPKAIGFYHSHSAPLAMRFRDSVLHAAAELAHGRVGR
jgi:hypothetical protein